MKKVAILHGPNLSLLGKREVAIYGEQPFETYYDFLKKKYTSHFSLSYFCSNTEGAIIDYLHKIGFDFDGILINAGAYTHTSIAIADAISAISTPCIEIHISNIHKREEFRKKTYMGRTCVGSIVGFGFHGYEMGLFYFLQE